MAQNDNEDEYEYEETTVMVELQGIMENDFLGQVTQAKILGIDTEKPLLQLDDYTFTGKYSDTMGTGLLFKDKTDSNDPKPGEKKLEYSCLTNKKLCLQRVFLKDNKDLDTKVDGVEIEKSDTPGGVKTVHPEKADAQPGTSNAGVETDHIHLDTAKTAMDHDISSKTVDIEEVKAIQDTNK